MILSSAQRCSVPNAGAVTRLGRALHESLTSLAGSQQSTISRAHVTATSWPGAAPSCGTSKHALRRERSCLRDAQHAAMVRRQMQLQRWPACSLQAPRRMEAREAASVSSGGASSVRRERAESQPPFRRRPPAAERGGCSCRGSKTPRCSPESAAAGMARRTQQPPRTASRWQARAQAEQTPDKPAARASTWDDDAPRPAPSLCTSHTPLSSSSVTYESARAPVALPQRDAALLCKRGDREREEESRRAEASYSKPGDESCGS